MPTMYRIDTMGDAHLLVAQVAEQGFADLLVHRVSSRGLATRPWLWYFTTDKQMARYYVHFCSLGMAQLAVCFVDSYGAAGWVSQNPAVRRLLPSRG